MITFIQSSLSHSPNETDSFLIQAHENTLCGSWSQAQELGTPWSQPGTPGPGQGSPGTSGYLLGREPGRGQKLHEPMPCHLLKHVNQVWWRQADNVSLWCYHRKFKRPNKGESGCGAGALWEQCCLWSCNSRTIMGQPSPAEAEAESAPRSWSTQLARLLWTGYLSFFSSLSFFFVLHFHSFCFQFEDSPYSKVRQWSWGWLLGEYCQTPTSTTDQEVRAGQDWVWVAFFSILIITHLLSAPTQWPGKNCIVTRAFGGEKDTG